MATGPPLAEGGQGGSPGVPPRSVVLVGDSHLTEDSSTGVTKLGARLRRHGWTVVSRARGGLDTRAALQLLMDFPPAEWTVYSFGSNDAAPRKEVPLPEFESSYRRLLAMARSGHVVVLGPPPVNESSAGAWGRTNARLRRYSDCAAKLAAEVGGLFIPLLDLVTADTDLVDGLHLNDTGYEKLAAALPTVRP
jgi:lysophospholipase L1-like esterase